MGRRRKKHKRKYKSGTVHCMNCLNFKTRVITSDMVKKVKVRSRIELEIVGDTMGIPLTPGMMKNIDKRGEIQILYCIKDMMARKVYLGKASNNYLMYTPENVTVCQCYE